MNAGGGVIHSAGEEGLSAEQFFEFIVVFLTEQFDQGAVREITEVFTAHISAYNSLSITLLYGIPDTVSQWIDQVSRWGGISY